MPIPLNQRWLFRRDKYRPAGETIRTADYSVEPIGETAAKDFVVMHHYSGTYPAARFRFGLFRGSKLAGVAVFSQPCSDRVLTNVFRGVRATDAAELGRFVLLDSVPGNGETWFLGRAFEALRAEGLAGVLSFSDPTPRRNADGVIVFPGHIGTIYQAHNGTYLGRSHARSLHVLPDGTIVSDRSLQKIRAGERGWRYAADSLTRHGAAWLSEEEGSDRELRTAWLREALRVTTRGLRHPGNHRYAWGLTRAMRRSLDGRAYPKVLEAA
jgi:hypothetical protein